MPLTSSEKRFRMTIGAAFADAGTYEGDQLVMYEDGKLVISTLAECVVESISRTDAVLDIHPDFFGTFVNTATAADASSCAVDNVEIATTGDALLAFVAWDPAGAITLSSVKLGATDFTLIETLTVGGGSGYKLATWKLVNQAAVSGGTVTATLSGTASSVMCGVVNIRDCAAAPTDQMKSATGSGTAVAVTGTADTAQVDELLVAFVLVAGDATATASVPAGYTEAATVGNAASTPLMYVHTYYCNVNAIATYSLASTLSDSRDWAAALYALK